MAMANRNCLNRVRNEDKFLWPRLETLEYFFKNGARLCQADITLVYFPSAQISICGNTALHDS